MHPKDADGMANSVDPDQTASALFAETYLSQYIEFVRYELLLNSLQKQSDLGLHCLLRPICPNT